MKQYNIVLINLDPTAGHEMNDNLATLIVAPMTTKSHKYPTRIQVIFQNKKGWIVLDQIRTIDKIRVIKTLGKLEVAKIAEVKNLLDEMLVK